MITLKFQKLTEDLKKSKAACVDAAKGEDGGTANLDTMYIRLPRMNESKVLEAIKKAGLYCRSKSSYLGRPCYFIGPGAGGQGNSRTRAVEAMKKVMQEAGWDVSIYYQMD